MYFLVAMARLRLGRRQASPPRAPSSRHLSLAWFPMGDGSHRHARRVVRHGSSEPCAWWHWTDQWRMGREMGSKGRGRGRGRGWTRRRRQSDDPGPPCMRSNGSMTRPQGKKPTLVRKGLKYQMPLLLMECHTPVIQSIFNWRRLYPSNISDARHIRTGAHTREYHGWTISWYF